MKTRTPLDRRHRAAALPCPARPFLDRLVRAGSDLGRQLAGNLDLSVRDYVASLLPAAPPPRNPHREVVAQALAEVLDVAGIDDLDDVCEHLLRVPVIQQADHANLLLDPETFANNYLFHLGCRERGVGLMVVSQCNTVSCLSRRDPVWGPVFLRTRGGLYQVFPHSKRQLKDSTFCALPAPTRLSFDRLEGDRDLARDPLAWRLVGREVVDPSAAYRVANDEIWDLLPIERKTRRVQVDESLASHAAALEISNPHGAITRLLFDPAVRDRFHRVKRELVASRANLTVNRAEPDHLWLRRESRLVPVVQRRSGVRAEMTLEDGSSLPVPFRPAEVAAALRDGTLFCDRVLAYLVRCLFPAITAVGGTSQQDYVALYRAMVLETHRLVPFLDEDELRAVSDPGASRLGGAPLVELGPRQHRIVQELGAGADLGELEESFLDRPLAETIGSLSCAGYFHGLLARRGEP
ncbi:MAG TPA: hypothetical protein VK698_17585 [Kofleriaceae bacterium]|nr:hypothetical protein [Kofleriaceae bacterium]